MVEQAILSSAKKAAPSRRAEDHCPRRATTIQPHSARSASNGEIKLARSAGIKEAISAENPSATTAIKVTTGSYGFMP
jgi:hypothetical protein